MKMFGAHNGNLELDEDALEGALDEYFWGVSHDDEQRKAGREVLGRTIVAYLAEHAHYAIERDLLNLERYEKVLRKIAETNCSHGNPALNECGSCIAEGFLAQIRPTLPNAVAGSEVR